MKSVNAPTQMLLDLFRNKSEQNPGAEFNAGHPFFTALEAAEMIGVPTEGEEFRNATVRSLTLWAASMVGSMIVEVLNEISKLGKAAIDAGGEAKAASEELLDSMDFVRSVFQAWANELDLEHIAEFVFADGQQRYLAQKEADPDAFKRSPRPKMTPEEVAEELFQKLKAAAEEAKKREEEKKAVKKEDGPPVTPKDIMKMLFENRTKPSVN